MIDTMAHTTTNHDLIKRWAEERGGCPTVIQEQAGTAVRIDFGRTGKAARPGVAVVGWEVFFDTFEARNLALIYQSRDRDGRVSRFCRLVERN